ncbi:hypothetical protein [Desulfosporosinus sp. HMP52]|nr:hypothetical protein [Desulfosporosinus sp. HMP52]
MSRILWASLTGVGNDIGAFGGCLGLQAMALEGIKDGSLKGHKEGGVKG